MESTHRRIRPWPLRSVGLAPRSASSGSVGLRRGESGETLIEVLIAVTLTGFLVTAILGGVFTSIKASVVQRNTAVSEVVVRNVSVAITDMPYVPCATKTSYAPPADRSGYVVTFDSVQVWNTNNTPYGAGPTCVDTGLQKISYSVTSGNGGRARQQTMLKRSDEVVDDFIKALPAGGVRCTFVADRDTYLDQGQVNMHPDDPDRNKSMGVSGAAGKVRSLVYFNVKAKQAECGDGGKVPDNMVVRSASLRVYTWLVSGAPDCATQCNHALRRVTGAWSEASTPNDFPAGAPSEVSTPSALFSHGAVTGDYSPRYQTITGSALTSDVDLFYRTPNANQGWSIERDCGGGGCASANSALFQMRTREWGQTQYAIGRQVPTLTVILAPPAVVGKQLRNVASGRCAWISDNMFAPAAQLKSKDCAGTPDQLWIDNTGLASGGLKFTIQAAPLTSPEFQQCLTIDGNNVWTGPTTIWPCDKTQPPTEITQRWSWSGSYIINQRLGSGSMQFCLTEGLTAGSTINAEPCISSARQQWILELPPQPAGGVGP